MCQKTGEETWPPTIRLGRKQIDPTPQLFPLNSPAWAQSGRCALIWWMGCPTLQAHYGGICNPCHLPPSQPHGWICTAPRRDMTTHSGGSTSSFQLPPEPARQQLLFCTISSVGGSSLNRTTGPKGQSSLYYHSLLLPTHRGSEGNRLLLPVLGTAASSAINTWPMPSLPPLVIVTQDQLSLPPAQSSIWASVFKPCL